MFDIQIAGNVGLLNKYFLHTVTLLFWKQSLTLLMWWKLSLEKIVTSHSVNSLSNSLSFVKQLCCKTADRMNRFLVVVSVFDYKASKLSTTKPH